MSETSRRERDLDRHDGTRGDADGRLLSVALALIVGFLVLEAVVGLMSGSLALLSDAGHMATDALALAMALWALHLARRPARGGWTFGFRRAEILSAAINGLTLAVMSVVVTIEAVHRLLAPPAVEGAPVLGVAAVGIAVNVLATWLVGKANRESLNIEGAFRHLLTDLFGFVATLAAGLVVVLTGWTRADAIASLVVVALMVHSAWQLLGEAGLVLLEAAPSDVDLQALRASMTGVDHVRGVHDLHVWTITSSENALSAHVILDDECFGSGHAPQLLDRIQEMLSADFGIEHSTLQLEPARHVEHEAPQHS